MVTQKSMESERSKKKNWKKRRKKRWSKTKANTHIKCGESEHMIVEHRNRSLGKTGKKQETARLLYKHTYIHTHSLNLITWERRTNDSAGTRGEQKTHQTLFSHVRCLFKNHTEISPFAGSDYIFPDKDVCAHTKWIQPSAIRMTINAEHCTLSTKWGHLFMC